MLARILKEMYIEPELLAELPEQDKQLLFMKIREEQIRRYNEFEKSECLEIEKEKFQCIKFASGKDGKEWVWVMGEFPGDKTLEELIEDHNLQRAKQIALKELEHDESIFDQSISSQDSKNSDIKSDISPEKQSSEPKSNVTQFSASRFAKREASNDADSFTTVQLRPSRQLNDSEQRRRREQDLINRRSCEIMLSFKQIRDKLDQQAQLDSLQVEQNWQTRERKAKLAEAERQKTFKWAATVLSNAKNSVDALTELRNSSSSQLSFQNNERNKSLLDVNSNSLEYQSAEPRPRSVQEFVDWFRSHEVPRKVFLESQSHSVLIAHWFHGLIEREQAEVRLEQTSPNSFLVRCDPRVFGYAISYSTVTKVKHLLVLVTPAFPQSDEQPVYHVLGSSQAGLNFRSLRELISHYQKHSISSISDEFLIQPIGQSDPQNPDYIDLFENQNKQTDLTKL